MDLNSIALWLKGTILGIIALGALGSICAIFILGLFRNIFARWLPQGLYLLKKHERKQAWNRGYVAGYIVSTEDSIKINIFASYLLSRLMLALFSFLFFCILFVYLLPRNSNNLLTFGTYTSIILALLSLRWVWSEIKFYKFLYAKVLKDVIKKAENSYQENVLNKTAKNLEENK